MTRLAFLLSAAFSLFISPQLVDASGSAMQPDVKYKKVTDLRSTMYKELYYQGGWYRNLNASTYFGSQALNLNALSTGALMNASYIQWPLQGNPLKVLVCSLSILDSVLIKLLNDSASSANVAGILVDPTPPFPSKYSSAEPFPASFNAPYANTSYVWNPAGSGLARRSVKFPVIEVSLELAKEISWRSQYNQDNFYKGALYMADMRLNMYGQINSTQCLLVDGTCDLIGGFSIWATMPPIPPLYNQSSNLTQMQLMNGAGAQPSPAPSAQLPITVITSQIDSNGLFHDYVQAADSPLTGLIAMLAAIDILRQTNASLTYTRRLAFLAMAGEPWDYMGSRRLLFDMYQNSTSTAGLNLALIDQVIEVGSIGRAYSSTSNRSTFYLHSQPSSGPVLQQNGSSVTFGNSGPLITALQTAAAATAEHQVTMSPASSTPNPGIPPSTLMSFLRHKPSIQGVVIEEFDSSFSNPYYESEADTAESIDAEPMLAAAVVLARTLHTLASPSSSPVTPLQFDAAATSDLILRLAFCLMFDSTLSTPPPLYSLMCQTVRSFINVGFSDKNPVGNLQPYPWRYTGLSNPNTPDPSNITNKREIFNFLFNIMANMTAVEHTNLVCDPFVNYCPAGMVCVGWFAGQNASLNANSMGRCKNATARFTPATSTRAVYSWAGALLYSQLVIQDEVTAFNTQFGWPADPIFTESRWDENTPYIRIFMKESNSTQVAVLVSGLLLSAATLLFSIAVQRAFEWKWKKSA